jgi:hypothetical protein
MKIYLGFTGAALALALVPSTIGFAAFAQSSGQSSGQSSDASYCTSLSDTYNRYVRTTGSRGAKSTVPTDVGTAMTHCSTSEASGAIPVLERALKDAKIDLPSRG